MNKRDKRRLAQREEEGKERRKEGYKILRLPFRPTLPLTSFH
jgi:hypothetical protein